MKEKALLFVGPTGTGKSAISNNYLMQLSKEKYIINNINFSAQTSANQTQDIIFGRYVIFFFSYTEINIYNKNHF
jgi:dynein heavy chain